MINKSSIFIIAMTILAAVLIFIRWSISNEENTAEGNYVAVEDFEDYNDYVSYLVFENWVDGSETGNNGSQIGNTDTPFMEMDIVHSGGQSVPFYYDLRSFNYAEVTVNTDNLPIGKDWTSYSLDTLTLWFSGRSENIPASMYIKLNDSKYYYTGDISDLKKAKWTRWDIELYKFNIDLKNVQSMSIGFNSNEKLPNGYGMVFFDDIRLYKTTL
jgi:hypothetical protein